LPAIRPHHVALHEFPPQFARRIIAGRVFSRSQGHDLPWAWSVGHVWFATETCRLTTRLFLGQPTDGGMVHAEGCARWREALSGLGPLSHCQRDYSQRPSNLRLDTRVYRAVIAGSRWPR
jgi:hypothetical protein